MNESLSMLRSALPTMLVFLGVVAGCAVSSAASGETRKSISTYVSCNGSSDDTTGAIKAFAAAKNSAFTLVVDCPVRLHSGIAVDRGIFIDNGTSVEFAGSGKFIVDNLFHPAFVIANSHNIKLTNWNVIWDAVEPIDGSTGGYEMDGKFAAAAPGTRTQPAAAFNDVILTKWLTANRAVNFDSSQGYIKSIWVGGVNIGAVFFITGDASDVSFIGLHLGAPPQAGAEHFVPMAVSFSQNWKSGQTVNGKTPHTAQYIDIPHKLTFSEVVFDGTLMGWQGNVRDVTFDKIQSHRYGDLQDAGNSTSGGIGKWFPPPHLFYLNYISDGDPGLFNSNIHISNVVDDGPRIGTARDKGGADGISGYASSLKLGCVRCSVDHYSTTRPDGFMDVLPSDGLTVSNVTATYDTAFLHNMFPAGIRFPAKGYSHVKFENLALRDTAAASAKESIGNAPDSANNGITFKNVHIVLNGWSGAQLPVPTIAGSNHDVQIDYELPAQQKKVTYRLQEGGHWSMSSPAN